MFKNSVLIDVTKVALRRKLSVKQLVAESELPKVTGSVINISIGGACVELKGSMKMKKNEEITMMFALPQLDDGSMPRGRAANCRCKG